MTISVKSPLLAAVAIAVTTPFLSAGSIAAEGPRYTYGEIGYVDVDFDDVGGVSADGDGFTLDASLAVADAVHLFAGYTDGDIDIETGFGDIDADYTSIAAGIGLNIAMSDTLDLVGRVAYINAEIESGGFDEDEDGYALGAGVRAMMTPELELNGGIVYSDLGGDFDDDTSLGLGAVYNFTEMFAAVGGIEFSDDVTQYGFGVRLYFGD